jgi:hypothetical protein
MFMFSQINPKSLLVVDKADINDHCVNRKCKCLLLCCCIFYILASNLKIDPTWKSSLKTHLSYECISFHDNYFLFFLGNVDNSRKCSTLNVRPIMTWYMIVEGLHKIISKYLLQRVELRLLTEINNLNDHK